MVALTESPEEERRPCLILEENHITQVTKEGGVGLTESEFQEAIDVFLSKKSTGTAQKNCGSPKYHEGWDNVDWN